MKKQKIITLKKTKAEIFWDPAKAVKRLIDDYEKSIRKLQENINLFDESIDVINSVKGDNNDG